MDIKIVIPSRRRSDRIASVLKMFPTAAVWVHESERAEYAAAAPMAEIVTHDRLDGIGAIRRKMIIGTDAEIVVMIDDDIKRVGFNCGDGATHKPITDADHIMAVIESTARTARELGASLFGWNRERRMQYFHPTEPFRVVYPCAGAYGVIGKKILPDPEFRTGEDIDMTCKALVSERIVWVDTRYTFDSGEVGKGSGGCQGQRTLELEAEMTRRLYLIWGSHVYRGPSKCPDKRGRMSMSIRVERKNNLASTR